MSDTPDRVRTIMAKTHNMHILVTVDVEGKPHARWMGALVESPESPWTFYLACGANSRKMGQIAANPHTQLVFTDQTKWEVATLVGLAEASVDAEPRQLLWDSIPMIKKYYSGPRDEKMGVIKFQTKSLELLCMHENREPVFLDVDTSN
jgi:general stress protein 26